MKTNRKKQKLEFPQRHYDLFDSIYETHKAAVFNFACSLTDSRKEAEDLFQDTWLRVVENPAGTENIKNQKAWLFTITANLHKDMLRKKRIRRLFLLDRTTAAPYIRQAAFSQENPYKTAEHKDIHTENREIIHNAISLALAALPEKLRKVFVLKEMQDFKYLEISKIMGMPVGTVKSTAFRAVKRLRRELADLCPDEIK